MVQRKGQVCEEPHHHRHPDSYNFAIGPRRAYASWTRAGGAGGHSARWVTLARKVDAMKKTCFVLLCALLLGLAPSTFAAEAAAPGPLAQLVNQLAAFFSVVTSELGWQYPPNGSPEAAESTEGEDLPPNNNLDTSDDPELGWQYPPGG